MALHHLRRHWPRSNNENDTTTREELFGLIARHLSYLDVEVGRRRYSRADTEEDFIERRALIVAQEVRRELIRGTTRRGETRVAEAELAVIEEGEMARLIKRERRRAIGG
jgi:hypothetical protein